MTQKDIIQSVARKTGISKQVTENLLRATVGAMSGTLRGGGIVKIQHFGSFEVRNHKARTVTNPKNGSQTVIPERDVWMFKANDALKNNVNK